RGPQSSAWAAGGAGAAGRGEPAAGRGRGSAYGVLAPNWAQGTGSQYLGGGGSAAARQLPPKRHRVEPPTKKNTLYNKRCVKCNGIEIESRRRTKLCKDNPLCRRWVHRQEMKDFNLSVEDRTATCCVHFNIADCECLNCLKMARRHHNHTTKTTG
ncbi:unnamed protein product, partial [Laminaria digitata]